MIWFVHVRDHSFDTARRGIHEFQKNRKLGPHAGLDPGEDLIAAGYIATGTHGTGIKTPILSTGIDRIRLIDGTGEIHELDAAHEPELFAAARVNLGCLGVVTEITFNVVEAYDLEERLDLVDFDTTLADLDNTLNTND